MVINELAHEFKNPMVTIKTVSQHLESLLEDDEGRQQVARLTGDAVARMDRTLENLLQFTRFRAPAPESIPLNALLAPCLTDLTPVLTERRLLLNYHPPDVAPVFVDAAQIVYAFDNLLRVVVRDLDEGETLGVRAVGAPSAIIFEFMSRHPSTAGKLAAFLDQPHAGEDGEASLGLVFARALVERNGGRVEVQTAGERTAITVWLPSRDELALEDGKTANLNS
jgi:signal transduction histidine kinase